MRECKVKCDLCKRDIKTKGVVIEETLYKIECSILHLLLPEVCGECLEYFRKKVSDAVKDREERNNGV